MAAVLVAIAIPIFTTQLERSKEGTDMSNIRAAYAEVMAEFMADGAKTNYTSSATVSARQGQTGWQNTENGTLWTRINGTESDVTVPAAVSGSTYTVTVSTDTNGAVTVSVGAA